MAIFKLNQSSKRAAKSIDSWEGSKPKDQVSDCTNEIAAVYDGSAATVHYHRENGQRKVFVATYDHDPKAIDPNAKG
ncbi:MULTISPECIES: hypothetical protein [unclassified Moorena]|uniref:hypothetical protein n=1 Tax=unclassified Moorena TaxID=2683338 RepID=UPI0013FB1343|nr:MULTISPECIES: hypothetical protein [unclassified Moorena]NEP23061.1 hypothetical protein [Moorena sp. SIO3I6]